jgi:hypothetical protein
MRKRKRHCGWCGYTKHRQIVKSLLARAEHAERLCVAFCDVHQGAEDYMVRALPADRYDAAHERLRRLHPAAEAEVQAMRDRLRPADPGAGG